jgi:peptidoglycan/xylan/chitin deacetylase (PgdA/CDA1 family)
VWRLLKLFKDIRHSADHLRRGHGRPAPPRRDPRHGRAGHEICSHGYRWIDYQYMDEAQEREHMLEAIRILTELTGERPLGWYTGRTGPNTRRLVMEEGGFLYDCDTYDDDLPYWEPNNPTGKPHLVIPYTLDTNDMRFTQVQGFNKGDDSSSTSRTPSTCCTPKAPKPENALHRPALPPGRPPGAPGRAQALRRLRQEP